MTKYINGNDLEWNPSTSGERRKDERRTDTERREMIRFALERRSRTSSDERRKTATSWGSSKPV
jgi:hypothetical protein